MSKHVEGYRLSPQQERLWQLCRNGLPVNSQCAIEMSGNLRASTLREALQQIVNRHEILHTGFYRSAGVRVPIQVLAETVEVGWSEEDWSALSRERQQAGLAERLAREEVPHEEAAEAGEQQAARIRASLLKLTAQRHLLHVSLPSLCADGWTIKNLVGEIARAYAERLTGGQADGEVVQYLQFSEWQNELLEDENAEQGFAYWRQQNEAPARRLALPFERPLRRQAPAEYASIDLRFADGGSLAMLAQRLSVPLDVLLLAAWQTLLWRLSGQADIVVGQILHGRKYEELHGALGLFAKALPIHCEFNEALPFSQVVQRLSASVSNAYDWQEWFIWSGRQASGDGAAEYFDAGYEYAQWPAPESAGGVWFSLSEQRVVVDRFNIKLQVFEQGDSLRGQIRYQKDRFRDADISLLADQLQTLLVGVTQGPDAAVGRLDMLSEAERQRLLIEFNKTAAPYPAEKLVHQLFEEQVERTPESVALVFRGEAMSYREVNDRANQLAHHLRSLGVGPEVLVAVACERSPQMVVALLGVLKAGGAYLPIDLTSPPERLLFMLQEAAVAVLLTEERWVSHLPLFDGEIFCLDEDWPGVARQSKQNPPGQAQPENPAYVIYTSGSTGKPKGVVIPHRGVVNYLSWCATRYAVEQGSGAVVHSPIGFDLTVTSLYAPLLSGQAVILTPEDEGIESVSSALENNRGLTLVKVTPAHLEAVNQLLPAEAAAGSTQTLVIGGEALYSHQIAYWREHAPLTRLINEYGPTETVVGCCVYEVGGDTPQSGAIPIGRPIANTRIYVLDADLRPVPAYVAGEVYIGGDGLARGYLNRPQITAEKFLPDPFSPASGARMYRTGDLARHLGDGQLEYLGRDDQQVKIRGFRVELGEIEAVLGQHPAVSETAVLVREDVSDVPRLVAYIVSRNDSEPSVEALRDYLREKLPDYMVPSSFMLLDALPLTPNGKLDRRALPVPKSARWQQEGTYVAPQTETERAITAIWQEVLQIEQVGIYDNFFDMGGHSLLMVRVSRKLQEALGKNLSIVDLFKYPTVDSLTRYLSEQDAADASLTRSQTQARARQDSAARQREMREKRRALKVQQEVENG